MGPSAAKPQPPAAPANPADDVSVVSGSRPPSPTVQQSAVPPTVGADSARRDSAQGTPKPVVFNIPTWTNPKIPADHEVVGRMLALVRDDAPRAALLPPWLWTIIEQTRAMQPKDQEIGLVDSLETAVKSQAATADTVMDILDAIDGRAKELNGTLEILGEARSLMDGMRRPSAHLREMCFPDYLWQELASLAERTPEQRDSVLYAWGRELQDQPAYLGAVREALQSARELLPLLGTLHELASDYAESTAKERLEHYPDELVALLLPRLASRDDDERENAWHSLVSDLGKDQEYRLRIENLAGQKQAKLRKELVGSLQILINNWKFRYIFSPNISDRVLDIIKSEGDAGTALLPHDAASRPEKEHVADHIHTLEEIFSQAAGEPPASPKHDGWRSVSDDVMDHVKRAAPLMADEQEKYLSKLADMYGREPAFQTIFLKNLRDALKEIAPADAERFAGASTQRRDAMTQSGPIEFDTGDREGGSA